MVVAPKQKERRRIIRLISHKMAGSRQLLPIPVKTIMMEALIHQIPQALVQMGVRNLQRQIKVMVRQERVATLLQTRMAKTTLRSPQILRVVMTSLRLTLRLRRVSRRA